MKWKKFVLSIIKKLQQKKIKRSLPLTLDKNKNELEKN